MNNTCRDIEIRSRTILKFHNGTVFGDMRVFFIIKKRSEIIMGISKLLLLEYIQYLRDYLEFLNFVTGILNLVEYPDTTSSTAVRAMIPGT